MKINRLKLHGFKSFVDATDIPVEPGLTGIIGPNGCGKSNLVEGLRFVMGESSYKAMRGGGMEDVIFAGSGGRPARNMADVTLVAERPGDAGAEILEISRRIERDAGSTYRLNGKEVRARDVQLLFADASTGARSSALVRQGQIGEIIAAKPEQRRGILEDAAGISGLHSRRHEAELKLRAAEQNLERLSDVTGEIEVQLEALKRQARQAVRYRNLSGEIRKAEAALASLNLDNALVRLRDAEGALTQATTILAEAGGAQAEAAKTEAIAADALPGLREKAAACGAALQRMRLLAEELDREEGRLRARREDLAGRREQIAADMQHESESAAESETARAALDAEAASLRAGEADSAGRIEEAARLAVVAAAAVTELETAFNEAAGTLASARTEQAAKDRALRDSVTRLDRLKSEREAIGAQRARLEAEHGQDQALGDAAAAVAAAEAALAAGEAEAQAAEAALGPARDAEQRARGPKEEAERRLGTLRSEAETLGRLLDLDKSRDRIPVMDHLDVTPGYERALVAALGDDLDAALESDAPSFWGESGSADDDLALPYGTEPLSRFVTGPAVLARRLRQIGVVGDDEAEALVTELAAGQRLVTRSGSLWRWDGLRARKGSADAAARRLEQRRRVADLGPEIEAAESDFHQAATALDAARAARGEAEALDTRKRDELRSLRRALDAARVTLTEAERRAGRVGERLSAFAGALARIESDIAQAEADRAVAAAAMQKDVDIAGREAERDEIAAKLAGARGHASEMRHAADQAEREAATRNARLAEIVTECQRWTARETRSAARLEELRGRLAAIESELGQLADEPQDFDRRRRAILQEIAGAEQAAAAAADQLATAETGHRSAATAARAALEALSGAREARAREEERVAAAQARKDEVEHQIAETFGGSTSELREIAELKPGAPLPEVASVETKLQRLKAERERLGGVNLRAEEEAREIDDRLAVMRNEREDLEAAIARLRQGIQSLNREGREKLLAAFERVNEHFRSLFQLLFGGGTAELTLAGADDPLEAGLEIIARPPGKKPQSMTLLSGGEQALTALSLIFAAFLTNPSPICVLDEVDAPLDDANVERFCALVDEMRRRTDTRFIVVTHNPITMARMDRLFGVTMAERGVSQIVSVDLESAERFREAG